MIWYGPIYHGANFPLTWNLRVPLMVIPLNRQNLRVVTLTVFFGYPHSSSVYFVLPSNSLGLWLLVLQLPWSCLGQIGFFLKPRTTLMGFGISFHTRLRMVPSLNLLGNCCYSRILWMIGSFPSLFHRSICKLIACLPISSLLFLSIHLSADDRQSYSLGVFLKLCVGLFIIERWIEFLYLRLFGLVLHII